jgi:hypothetical protein
MGQPIASRQWSGTLQSQNQLAQVIQGEARTPAGQFAVASTMYNRMAGAEGFSGSGTMDVTKVVTPSQYNGINYNPSANAQALASDLWQGLPPRGGDPGNATVFASPAAGAASWANSNFFNSGTQIGTERNVFSDRLGPPSENFRPPVYGGQPFYTPNATEPPPAGNTDAPAFGTDTPAAGSQYPVSSNVGVNVGATAERLPSDPFGDSATPYSPQNAPDVSNALPSDISEGINAQNSAFSSANPGSGPAGNSSVPAAIDAQSRQDAKDTSATIKGISGLAQSGLNAANVIAKAATRDQNSANTTTTNVVDKIDASVKNLFSRGSLVFLGAVFVIGGLWLFRDVDGVNTVLHKK